MVSDKRAPVIAIDGPSGSGKGTVSTAVASHLGWHYLDSGAVYRVLGFLAQEKGVALDDVSGLVTIAQSLDVSFRGSEVWLNGKEIRDEIRTEEAGKRASLVLSLIHI